jgi:hypothetical protein
MATGIKPGLNPAKRAGSGPDNKGLEEAEIAVAMADDIGIGTIVYRSAVDGTIQVGASGDGEDAYGVSRGVSYVRPADGEPVEAKFYPGGLTPVERAKCKVSADPANTYLTRGNADVSAVFPGQIYAMEASSVDVATGHETALVDIAGGTTLGNDSIDVEIVKVHDATNLPENRVLEVRLVRHELDR